MTAERGRRYNEGYRGEKMNVFFFFQAEDGIRDYKVTGVQTCALPIYRLALAIRTAQAQFGKGKPMTGEQVRWGIEHLNIDDKRLKELGATGLMQALKVSCMDHEGGGAVKFLQWDGKKWNVITDWIASDQSIVRPMIEASAAQYAKEKGIAPRDCSKEK